MIKLINFITPVNIPTPKNKISCETKILTLGSCFSDHIGSRLVNHFFHTLANPFGTIFNPYSIANVLDLAINNNIIETGELESEEGRFFHYDFHTSFDNSNPQQVASAINKFIKDVNKVLKELDFMILTFGTSIVYKLKGEDRIVSNCHKVPNHNFKKEFLSVDFMERRIGEVLDQIKRINPAVKIILTVSPVRHTKEGLVENNLSKSRLIELCHRLKNDNSQISYFPAFEIMMDELRDYRYYKSDLIHPSDLAVDIIWSRFMESYFDGKAIQKVKDVSEINAARNHKPFDPLSDGHQKFKQAQLKKIDRFKKEYSEIDFQEFENYFK